MKYSSYSSTIDIDSKGGNLEEEAGSTAGGVFTLGALDLANTSFLTGLKADPLMITSSSLVPEPRPGDCSDCTGLGCRGDLVGERAGDAAGVGVFTTSSATKGSVSTDPSGISVTKAADVVAHAGGVGESSTIGAAL